VRGTDQQPVGGHRSSDEQQLRPQHRLCSFCDIHNTRHIGSIRSIRSDRSRHSLRNPRSDRSLYSIRSIRINRSIRPFHSIRNIRSIRPSRVSADSVVPIGKYPLPKHQPTSHDVRVSMQLLKRRKAMMM